MQLKSRHLLLFAIACLVLHFAQTPGGALLAIGVFLQLALLLHGFEISRRSQLGAFKIFLSCVPLLMFVGGIHSFVRIYMREGHYLFLTMASAVLLVLMLLLAFQIVFSYYFLEKNNFELIATLQDAFNSLKDRRREFFKIGILLFLFSYFPWLESDWKLVFAVTATHLYLNRARLKTAIVNF